MYSPTIRRLAAFALALSAACSPRLVRAADGPDFHTRLGLQLWSVRAELLAHPAAALDRINRWDLSLVETIPQTARTPEQFEPMLKSHGLQAVSTHNGYQRFEDDLPGIIAEAKTYGARYVVCSSLIGKVLPLDEAHTQEVAEHFDRWARTLAASGLGFAYHTHGQECRPLGKGTALDYILKHTSPAVKIEMDVFWIRHGGSDPVKLLAAYPGRYVALHLKDMRVGAPTGIYDPKGTPPTDCVAVGSGAIDWPAVLRAAAHAGVTEYYIEDETTDPNANITQSLAYLRRLSL